MSKPMSGHVTTVPANDVYVYLQGSTYYVVNREYNVAYIDLGIKRTL